jgi:hypothetical protein
MTQCEEQQADPVAPTPAQSNAGGWVFLGVLLAVIVYEIVAVKTGRPTISQWTKRTFGRRRWWRAFGMGVIGLTLWHLFFGGPL